MGKFFELASSVGGKGAYRMVRNAHTKQEIKDFVKEHKDENVYMSVYEFKELDGNKPFYDSALCDRLFLDIDGTNHGLLNDDTWNDLKRVIDWCKSEEAHSGLTLRPQIFFSGSSGYHVLFRLAEHLLELRDDKIVKRLITKLKLNSGSKFIDLQANTGFAQLRRIPNTKNLKSGYYCIPLTVEEAYNFPPADVLRLAEKPRKLNNDDGTSDYFTDIIKAMRSEDYYTKKAEAVNGPKPDHHNQAIKYIDGTASKRPIRTCILQMMAKDNPNFREAGWIACELLRCMFTVNQICSIFKIIRREKYDDSITRYQVNKLKEKGIHAPSCKTLEELGYCSAAIHQFKKETRHEIENKFFKQEDDK